jgi:glycosyltransferase involved in cell wall biosynthesis
MNLSIVIPTYNEEKYLERTLDSIKDQICNITREIIISDSNSVDRTRKIAEKYGARIVIGSKKGPALGRNLGSKVAMYDFLIFINADVMLEPNLFDILAKNMVDGSIIYLVKLKPDKKSLLNTIIFELYNAFNPILIRYMGNFAIYPGEFICIRRDVFNRIKGFKDNYHLSEDRDLVIRAIRYGKVKFLKETYAEISLRRVEKWGWTRFLLFHLYSHIFFTLFKKPIQNKYEEIR